MQTLHNWPDTERLTLRPRCPIVTVQASSTDVPFDQDPSRARRTHLSHLRSFPVRRLFLESIARILGICITYDSVCLAPLR